MTAVSWVAIVCAVAGIWRNDTKLLLIGLILFLLAGGFAAYDGPWIR